MKPVVEMAEGDAGLDALCSAYLNVAADDPGTYRLMFWLMSAENDNAVRDVVEQIIAGLAKRLGSTEKGRVAWSVLHGAAVLGASMDETIATVRAMAKPKATRRKKLTSTEESDQKAERSERVDMIDATEPEDVCLL